MAGYNNMQRGPAPPLYGGGQRGGFGQVPRGVPGRMPSPNPMAMRRQGIGIGPGGGRPPMPGGGRPPHRPVQGVPGQEYMPQGLNRMGAQGQQSFDAFLAWLNDAPYGDMMRTGNPQAPYDQPKGGGPGGGGQPRQPGGMGRPSRPLYSPPGGGRPPRGGGRPPMNRQFSQPVPGGVPYDFGQFSGGGGQSPLYQPPGFGGMPPMQRGY